jgi:hypothetical protein
MAWLHNKHRKTFVLPLTAECWNKYVYLKKMQSYGQFVGITLRETSWLGGVIDYNQSTEKGMGTVGLGRTRNGDRIFVGIGLLV